MAEFVNGVDVNATNGGGGTTGALTFTRTRVTGDYAVLSTDYVIETDTTSGKITVTLPDATAFSGREIPVVNVAGSKRTRVTASVGLVGGLATFEFLYLRQDVSFLSDGTNWNAIGLGDTPIDPASRSDVTVKTRFRGNSGITLVSGAVSSWAPLGPAAGYTNAAAQATAASRPTISTGWSGDEDAVLFDGGDDYVATTVFAGGAIPQPTTIFLVGDTNSASQKIMFDGIASGNRQNSDFATTTLSAYAGSSLSTTFSTAQNFVNNKRVLGYVFNNTSSALFHNGQKMVSGTTGTGTLTGLTLGARYSVDSFFWSGNIGEHLVVSGALSDWVMSRISRFYLDYWQLPSVY